MTKIQTNPRRLLRVKEAAIYVSLSPWRLRKLVQDGHLPLVKYADNAPWLLDVQDLDGWVQRNKHNLRE
jgi:excisionase family DNA binding protein